MNYLKSFWECLKSNGPILCLFVFLAAWVWSNAAMRQAEANNRKDAIACETLCFPQQSEYLTKGDTGSCWCYLNQNEMKRSQ